MKVFFGIALIVLSLAIAIIPQFTNCYADGKVLTLQNGSTVPMKCHWTAQAEIAVAVPLLAVGAMLTASRRRESTRNLSVVGIVLGAFVLALPTGLIGVCPTPTMTCHTVMSPSLLVLGSAVIVGSLASLVIAQRSKDT